MEFVKRFNVLNYVQKNLIVYLMLSFLILKLG